MTTNNGLLHSRQLAGLTQADMAERMCIPLRTYEDIEAGRSKERPIHHMAADYALLKLAIQRDDISFLPDHLKVEAIAIRNITPGNKKPAE